MSFSFLAHLGHKNVIFTFRYWHFDVLNNYEMTMILSRKKTHTKRDINKKFCAV